MTRAAYGKDAIYARMAHRQPRPVEGLERASGLPIFHPTGVLFFSAGNEPYIADIIAVAARSGFATEAMDRGQMARRFPMIDFGGIDVGVFEPGFGALMARRRCRRWSQRFVAAGGDYRHAEARPGSASGGELASLRLSGDSLDRRPFRVRARAVAGQALPRPARPPHLRHPPGNLLFAPPAGDRRFPPGLPGWADFNGGDLYYGFPDLEGRGVKFARDTHGPRIDPDTQSRRHSARRSPRSIAFRDRRFPLLRGAPLTEAASANTRTARTAISSSTATRPRPMSCWSAADRATASSTAPKSAASPPLWRQDPAPRPNRASPLRPRPRRKTAKCIDRLGRDHRV